MPDGQDRALDRIDRKIIALLQQDATLSVADVSRLVNLSQTPCWKRIQRLEATGVITGRVAIASPRALGLDITVFTSLELADHSHETLDALGRLVSELPEVVEAYRMAGDVDYKLKVVCPSMEAYDRLYQILIARLPLKKVTSRFAMERIKFTTALPTGETALLPPAGEAEEG